MLAVRALLALGHRPTWVEPRQEFRQAQCSAPLPKVVTPAKLRHDVADSSKACSRGDHAWQEGQQSGYFTLPATCRDLSLVPGRDVNPGMPRPVPLMMCTNMIWRTQPVPLQMR